MTATPTSATLFHPNWKLATSRLARVVIVASAAVVAVVGFTSVSRSGAFFSDSRSRDAAVGAGRIFPGSRSSSAFVVADVSGGGSVDRSSPFAVAGDGLTQATGSWSTGFSSSRYVEFDLNAPLPAGLAATATFNVRFASASAASTLCIYLDVRRTSTGSLLGTYGSAGSPLGCATGTTMATVAQGLGAVGSSDTANDLSVRVYGADSAASSSAFDLATVTGSTSYATYTLYPAEFTDAADGTPASVSWLLQGP